MIRGRELTSTDFLILALERYNTSAGTVGNTCRYVLQLNGAFDIPSFEEKLNNSQDLRILSALKIKTRFFGIPKWEIKEDQAKRIKINIWNSDELIPQGVQDIKLSVEDSKIFSFDIVKSSDGNSTLIFSWHHLVMDGYGAVLLLKELVNEQSVINSMKYQQPALKYNRSILWRSVILFFQNARLSISGLFKPSLPGINGDVEQSKVVPRLKIMSFTEEETANIDKNAIRLGAKFGRSPYYLACSARTIRSILAKRGIVHDNFWIPVPQDRRKKGAKGPLIGNHLAFLFYDLKMNILESLEKSVKTINGQMVDQLRKQIPTVYEALMRGLRKIPLPIFYQFVKGPKGGSLASFLFTVAADHPKDLMEIEGCKVINALSFPPNTYPPGVTFAFMKFENKLQIMLLYYQEVLSEQEVKNLEHQIKYELINGKEL